MAQELDEMRMREKIEGIQRIAPLKSHCQHPSGDTSTICFVCWVDQILEVKTSNGYSIRQMIEFFGKIKCDTQREAVVRKNKPDEKFPNYLYLSELGKKLYDIVSGEANISESSSQPGVMLSCGGIAEAILNAGFVEEVEE